MGVWEGKLCLCDWQYRSARSCIDRRIQKALQAEYVPQECPVLETACQQLGAYFRKERHIFDLPLLFVGTPFQQRVWHSLLSVPYGTTLSYAALSKQLGQPDAVRAVAAANGANAHSIIVPCHRIVGSNGEMTGYAGGLRAKKSLLRMEGATTEGPYKGILTLSF